MAPDRLAVRLHDDLHAEPSLAFAALAVAAVPAYLQLPAHALVRERPDTAAAALDSHLDLGGLSQLHARLPAELDPAHELAGGAPRDHALALRLPARGHPDLRLARAHRRERTGVGLGRGIAPGVVLRGSDRLQDI